MKFYIMLVIYNNARAGKQCDFTFKRSKSNREKFKLDFAARRMPMFHNGKRVIIAILTRDITHTPKSLLLQQMKDLIAGLSYSHIYVLAVNDETGAIDRQSILSHLP